MFKTQDFENFCELLNQRFGMKIEESKKLILQSKLDRLMRTKDIPTYAEYFEMIEKRQDEKAYQEFINVITTNTTSFFREERHFHFLEDYFLSRQKLHHPEGEDHTLRIWSAGCSAGQEPLSIGMLAKEKLQHGNLKILSTDINSQVLKKAMAGVYSHEECNSIPKAYLLKYFEPLSSGFRACSELLSVIFYRKLNLMDDFRFKHQFDLILCRNVMIYFDHATQEDLVNRFYDSLKPGGYFFIGHSESLLSKNHKFKYVEPSIYTK